MGNNDLFESSSTMEMTKYSQGAIVAGHYRITSPILSTFGGNIYKAQELQSGASKTWLLIQMEPYINCKNYAKEDMKNIQGGEYILDITGYDILHEFLEKCAYEEMSKQEEKIKRVFIQIMEWLNRFHTNSKQVFPFLNFHNILVSPQNIKVFGTSFEYDYFNCNINPYPHLIPPNYISYKHQQNADYKNISDYYSIAIMIWQTLLKRTPNWDEHSLQFIEPVQAGIFTRFIEMYVKQEYLKWTETPLKMFETLIVPQKTPEVSMLDTRPLSSNSNTTSSLTTSNISTTSGISPLPNLNADKRIKILEEREQQWQEKERQWAKEHAELLENQREIQIAHRKSIFKIQIITGVGIIILLLSCLGLFLVGFRMVTPEAIQQYHITQVQKDSWYILGLLQGQKISEAQEFCQQWINQPNAPLLAAYFQSIASIHELIIAEDSNKKNELKNIIANNLANLINQKEMFEKEIQYYQLPINMEQIISWAKIYVK